MIEIKIDDRELQQFLNRTIDRVSDMTPVMRRIAGAMHDAVEENFEQEGRPRWKPLAEATVLGRAKSGHWPGRILQVSGQLAASISQRATNNSAIVGTNKAYAAIQQFGGKAGRGKKVTIPARPFLTIPDEDIRGMVDVLGRYLVTP